jgi:hypothetical protein
MAFVDIIVEIIVDDRKAFVAFQDLWSRVNVYNDG